MRTPRWSCDDAGDAPTSLGTLHPSLLERKGGNMGPFAHRIDRGKVEEWKAFTRELSGPRRDEFRDMNRRHGITSHRAWLETEASGDCFAVVELEGDGAETFLQGLASSSEPFDSWFRDRISELHGIDFSNLPAGTSLELMLDESA